MLLLSAIETCVYRAAFSCAVCVGCLREALVNAELLLSAVQTSANIMRCDTVR